MNFELSESQRMARQLARDFAAREIVPEVIAHEHDESWSVDILRRMATVGLTGGPIPEEYGGAGLDAVGYALVCETMGGASASVYTAMSVQTTLVGGTIVNAGTEEQKRWLLPKICSGEMIGAYALSEPNAGSDPASMEVSATRDGDTWRLNGSKLWISNGCLADVILVFAQTDRSQGHRGVATFIVDGNAPGLRRTAITDKVGLRASNTAELAFEDVTVAADRVLAQPGKGFRTALQTLDSGRIGVGACGAGVAQACLDACVSYAKTREQFGRPIGGHQLIQEMLADMAIETEAARLLVLQAAARKDAGVVDSKLIAMAKYFGSETAVRAARTAIQLHGGYGYTGAFHVERYLRDALALTIYEGTSQVQKLIIGRELTGISAFG